MQNNGFYILATLAVVILFFGLRSVDDEGRFNPLREPAPTRIVVEEGMPKEIVVSARRDGHFIVRGELQGQRVELLVDTGASVTTLRESDAAKAGIRPMPRDYNRPLSTANGEVLGASYTLPSLTIEGVELENLDIVVLPDDRLGGNLLGVNALDRFAERRTRDGKLTLYTE
ncbi:retropepsin-like aspartic protease family protein [Parvularcula maris]|uniref:TIGR02281 family clan AA aspartic protease n=1 Tax=Parvularcula maris TaxID=2965077 RepID=A0A9X2L891_9PROT|nr:TIGR02281 family clan AA aspartic protease [Parvularcula maris]MCQ8183967.1 TIGR02281 family clan AA aspartic protease [Parvularcula maris]